MTASTAPATGLALDGVRIALGGRVLLELTARIEPGRTLTVMGPSGSGKSSLLGFIAGTLAPAFAASGDVRLDGARLNDLPTERRRTGMLFQDDLLFPHLSVGGNLSFALPPAMRGRAERRRAVDSALANADLAGFANRDPVTLSGGQ
ncbi:MAG: ATP-binding cassette domain-containing protein, partial [Rhodospirillales bacterium]|nr:ATP-binding cassette domain-containing protein [Rhodospirillales bacterium]